MDRGTKLTTDTESKLVGSFGQTSSVGSSRRICSFNLTGVASFRIDNDVESDTVSEAGDIRDRALRSNRLAIDHAMENGTIVPISENLQSDAFVPRDQMMHLEDKQEDDKKGLPEFLKYISCLLHLAVFGILGVITRYLLQKLFGPGVAGVTSNQHYMYLDLPSNMVGSFLMGWMGVVFKGDISYISDNLAIGLTTGYLGSLTTFSGWNQKMLDLSVDGHWLFAVVGFLLGLFLVAHSIIFGIQTAEGFKELLKRRKFTFNSERNCRVDSYKRHITVTVIFVLMLILLWIISGVMLKREFNSGSSEAQLWLACLVGPLGVWIRWLLARLNGRGLGCEGLFKWIPFGTLIANVSAACVMAALATTKKAVKTKTGDTVATGIRLGLLGCLSTVSTFIAEFSARIESKQYLRAYSYAGLTICLSFSLGVLIYNIPAWTGTCN